MIGKLTTSLRSPHVSVRQAADAIKHLLHLQAEGARSALNLNPVKLYLEAQVSHGNQALANYMVMPQQCLLSIVYFLFVCLEMTCSEAVLCCLALHASC